MDKETRIALNAAAPMEHLELARMCVSRWKEGISQAMRAALSGHDMQALEEWIVVACLDAANMARRDVQQTNATHQGVGT